MADLKPHFKDCFLRKNDKEIVLVSTVQRLATDFNKKLHTVQTPIADDFVAGLKLDNNNNLHATLKIKDNDHTIILNRQSSTQRNQNQDRELAEINTKLETVKSDVIKNAIDKFTSLTGMQETWYFMWSTLDLKSKMTIQKGIGNLRALVILFTNAKIHEVLNYEDCETAFVWQGFTVFLHHPRRIMGTVEEFEEEFRAGWPKMGKMWLSHCINSADRDPDDQLVAIKAFIYE